MVVISLPMLDMLDAKLPSALRVSVDGGRKEPVPPDDSPVGWSGAVLAWKRTRPFGRVDAPLRVLNAA